MVVVVKAGGRPVEKEFGWYPFNPPVAGRYPRLSRTYPRGVRFSIPDRFIEIIILSYHHDNKI